MSKKERQPYPLDNYKRYTHLPPNPYYECFYCGQPVDTNIATLIAVNTTLRIKIPAFIVTPSIFDFHLIYTPLNASATTF